MIYVCEDCGFLFFRSGEINECPFCEKNYIRYATKEESKKLQSLLKPEKLTLFKEEQIL